MISTLWRQHSVEKREIHCNANIFSTKQFRVKFFSEKLLSRNFCEKMVAVKFRNFHTVDNSVEKREIHCHANFFRQISKVLY